MSYCLGNSKPTDLNSTVDIEITVLQSKLIETHNKLIAEIEHSKDVQGQLAIAKQNIVQMKQQLTQTQQQYHSAQGQLQTLQSTNSGLQLIKLDLESVRAKLLAAMTQKRSLQDQLDDSKNIIAEKDQIIDRLQNTVVEKNTVIDEKYAEVEEVERLLMEKEKLLSEKKKIIGEFQRKLQQINQRQADKQWKISNSQRVLDEATKELLAKSNQIAALHQQNQSLLVERQSLLMSLNSKQNQLEDLRSEVTQSAQKQLKQRQTLRLQCDRLSSIIEEANLKVDNSDQNHQAALRSLKLEKERISQLATEINFCNIELRELRKKYDDKMNETIRLNDELREAKANQSSQVKVQTDKIRSLEAQIVSLHAQLRRKASQLETVRCSTPKGAEEPRPNGLSQMKEFVAKLEDQHQDKLRKRESSTALAGSVSSISSQAITPRKAGSLSAANPAQPPQAETNRHPQSSRSPRHTGNSTPLDTVPLQNVNRIQAELLACNLHKKSIQTEIAKMDQSKVKNKESLSRKKKLEQQQVVQEKRISELKGQLRKMRML